MINSFTPSGNICAQPATGGQNTRLQSHHCQRLDKGGTSWYASFVLQPQSPHSGLAETVKDQGFELRQSKWALGN
eukprot:CAMPEP_0175131304 /NCGR_PEP_ID=MMETSP0087-20121206/6468_1 /TAXON_ID=136419 /ORGANISM="Unknown Unknown, Strain D1" /LENGTH=74 /DNA_ID=CAMNT_0016413579 /DNA_START=560 /DNA_END=784 /DNA_ORIENTATION=-